MGFGTRRRTGRLSTLAVIGGGPAGLMAAETARASGVEVALYDAKGSGGHRFLVAGKGELNLTLTHSEPMPAFTGRYRERAAEVAAWLQDFDAEAVRPLVKLRASPVTGSSNDSSLAISCNGRLKSSACRCAASSG